MQYGTVEHLLNLCTGPGPRGTPFWRTPTPGVTCIDNPRVFHNKVGLQNTNNVETIFAKIARLYRVKGGKGNTHPSLTRGSETIAMC